MRKDHTNIDRINTESSQLSIFWYSLMFLSVGIGIYVRLKGIGKWPFSADEYFMAKSVRNILEYGLPRFEGGGYYVRGILYQYLAAPFFLVLSNDEFSLRIIPAFFNILAIPPLYWIGKKLSGLIVACIAVAFFSLSLWEIEFARYARMYAPFQAIFLWYLFFLYRVVVDNDERFKKWMYLFSFLGVFTFEGGIFLIILNFMPIIIKKANIRRSDFLISLVMLIFAYVYLDVNFRRLGAEPYLPANIPILHEHKSEILTPLILFQTMRFNITWILLSIAPLSLTLFGAYKLVKSDLIDSIAKICLVTLILLTLFNLFGLMILLSLVLFLLNIIEWRRIDKRILKQFLLVAVFNFIFWIVYGLTTEGWHHLFRNAPNIPFKKLLVILFKYPDVFEQIVYPWMLTIPIVTVMAFFLICFGVIEAFSKQVQDRLGYRFLASILVILCLFVGIIRTSYHETRYTFFLYPIIILLVSGSMYRGAELLWGNKKHILVALFVLTYLVFSEDFGISHMRKIDSKDVHFRLIYDFSKAKHYLIRVDYRTAAEIVNKEINDGDIVVTNLTPIDYYLKKRFDYYYLDARSGEFFGRVAYAGTRDLWTNSKLIYEEGALWTIVDHHLSLISKKINERYAKYLYGQSLDGMINIFRMAPNKGK